MLDFLMVSTKPAKYGIVEIYPKFVLPPKMKCEDLMIRGRDFYAIWDEENKMWASNERDALRLIDKELDAFVAEKGKMLESGYRVLYMWDAENGMIDKWHKYCTNQMRDSYHSLNETLTFANTKTKKTDYASKRLNYPLEKGNYESWDRLVSTLYSESERHKIEWTIGAIVSGDSKKLQKFAVFYGSAGTGKSTILGIIEKLFKGYCTVFNAQDLGNRNSQFPLEPFACNPLVAIQHDGDLSHIEDNTKLNSLVSHETMSVNTKNKSVYPDEFKCFLYIGTNKPVKITDAKSGLIRRLIDISPSGNKLNPSEYKKVMSDIDFELGAIAYHCLEVYNANPNAYDNYIPITMMGASNDFYNFVSDSYTIFKKDNYTTLKAAWEMYKDYCDEAKVPYPYPQRIFKEELKNYFHEYKSKFRLPDGTRVNKYYGGFKTDKFEEEIEPVQFVKEKEPDNKLIEFSVQPSIFDTVYSDAPAQYATEAGTPLKKWDKVTTTLSELDTSHLHYVKIPDEHHIVIDFDLTDSEGHKSYEKNREEASKWPETYAELSKSGQGIHLHYIYTGNPEELSRLYSDHIEIKVFTGNSSLRRKLTKNNGLAISRLSSGLPLKGEKPVINVEAFKSEKGLRKIIKRNLNKEIHPATKPSIDFIYKNLEDAYNSGMSYDVSDMYNSILAFAANSTNQSDYCLKKVKEMKFKSDTDVEEHPYPYNVMNPLVFYDVEVFPNLFLINWKFEGDDKPVVRMFNPAPAEVEKLLSMKLVGFNCRRYDNHILYGRLLGYSNDRLYELSRSIIEKHKNCFFREAYNLSYTDIYDFASAGNKKSLKKLEIEMGIHHQELGLPWDKPVPEDQWELVAKYCDNDVIATEAAFHYLKADWTARQILADLAGMSVNTSTNSLTAHIIFGNEKHPQSQFLYRNLAEPVMSLPEDVIEFLKEAKPNMMAQRHGEAQSLLPYFPGYEYKFGKSTYRGQEIGEGGRVVSKPGTYYRVALLDINSQHPNSAIAECIFGPKFTRAFREIVVGRVNIKHHAWEVVDSMLGGKLRPYIEKVKRGEMTAKELANGLKTAINAVYGQTDAGYDNPFRDKRNVDNIIAKRGALFMTELKYEVEKRGYTVAHIKTDSIKIPNADLAIIDFVKNFGEKYGYTFEHEATYEKMCLVNDAVYIAKFATLEDCYEWYGHDYIDSDETNCGENRTHGGKWTATGTQFQVPYVFKSLFSHEDITFDDLCETKSVSTALYLDMNEDLPDVSAEEATYEKLSKKYTEDALTTDICNELQNLSDTIAKGHDYHFIGRVGQFCPMVKGAGGGLLMRETSSNGYASANGAKGYRWLESEMVKQLHKEDMIDRSYYDKLANDAVDAVSKYCDFEAFVADDSVAPWYASDTDDEGTCPFDVR